MPDVKRCSYKNILDVQLKITKFKVSHINQKEKGDYENSTVF